MFIPRKVSDQMETIDCNRFPIVRQPTRHYAWRWWYTKVLETVLVAPLLLYTQPSSVAITWKRQPNSLAVLSTAINMCLFDAFIGIIRSLNSVEKKNLLQPPNLFFVNECDNSFNWKRRLFSFKCARVFVLVKLDINGWKN